MVQLCLVGWTLDDYFADCERQREHEQRREEIMSLPPLVIEQTWQLALFGDDVVVRETISEEVK